MIRTLIIISVVGTILSVVCLGAAGAMGGHDIATKGLTWGEWAVRVDEENDDVFIGPAPKGQGGVYINGKRVEEDSGDYQAMFEGPEETREFVWLGDSEVHMGLPADVTYIQGPTPKVVVTGPRAALDRFYVDEEKFRLRGWPSGNTFSGIPTDNDLKGGNRPPRLKIEITAPGVSRFDFSGSETLAIKNYSQDSLTLDFSGASKATAQGSARLLILDLSGAAVAELGEFKAEELSADMSSASRATVSARASANIDASGASRVVFVNRPAQVTQDLSGAASVEMASAPAPEQKAASKAAAK